jgi:hypothetical protein
MADLDSKAVEMFRAGATVNAVAKKLYKNYYAKAKQQHALFVASEVDRANAEPEPEGQEIGAPVIWDLQIEVPRDRVPALFASFTPQEQANAVAGVIQARMNALLEA